MRLLLLITKLDIVIYNKLQMRMSERDGVSRGTAKSGGLEGVSTGMAKIGGSEGQGPRFGLNQAGRTGGISFRDKVFGGKATSFP